MNKYDSIVNEEILKEFSEIHGQTLMNHVSNTYDIEAAIGFACLYCPRIIEVEGHIFIDEFYNENIDELKKQYKSRKDIEMFVNSWSLSSLLSDNENINYDVNYIDEFAKAVKYFWQMRVNMLFPDLKVIVEIGDQIMGEIGLSVTMYQIQ